MPDFKSNPAFLPCESHFLNMSISKIARIAPQSTAVFVCDIQEKFRGRIWQFPSVISVAGKMVSFQLVGCLHKSHFISHYVTETISTRLKLLELWICQSMLPNNTLKVNSYWPTSWCTNPCFLTHCLSRSRRNRVRTRRVGCQSSVAKDQV
jgi:hypothetical protein